MPEIRLRQRAELCGLGFTYSTSKHFTKNEEKIQEFKETRDSRHISQNELGKAYFQHNMTYMDFKDLPRRTVRIEYFVMKSLIFLKIQNVMDINEDLPEVFINFLITRCLEVPLKIKLCQAKN